MPLGQILQTMLNELRHVPSHSVKRVLSRGLNVVVQDDFTAYVLILARVGERPSRKEVETVLKFWPYDVSMQQREIVEGLYGEKPLMLALQVRVMKPL